MDLFRTLIDILTQNISVGTVSLPFSILGLVTRVALPFIGMVLAYYLLMWGTRKILALTKLKDEISGRVLKYVKLFLKFLVLGGLVASVGSLLEKEIYYWFSRFLGVMNQPFFVSGNTRVSVVTLLMLIPVFYLASWSGKYARRLLDSSLFRQFGMDEAKRFSIGSLTRYLVMTVVLLFGLSVVGIDLSALGVLLGVLGIGLGFGLQSIVANFFAGFIIISTRPIKEGDRVLVNGYDGIVQNIRFISTDIKTFQNENIIIPNSFFVDNAVHNYSYTDRKIVIVNEVGVSYNSDLERVRVILEEVNEMNPYRLQGPENVVRILSFGDNGIQVALRSLVKDVSFKADSFSWTNMEIWKAFKKEGIEIPFPQRVVHIESMPGVDKKKPADSNFTADAVIKENLEQEFKIDNLPDFEVIEET
ncbi:MULTISPECIES: mechanosensitive ion channel family protein [unclassified Oceanispirochaeta]|uniref:mechanosensitive ion channel family protein n=1 Tax=unclassified Oceanispirochaeta TaxID=2635722 RepID=UPI000E08E5CA|nr:MULTISPECIES: mechanosensitive ion channel domain-containing protein [unclassified Oceanispirochaeta]MBF9014730.1 mechanosensitive ion channel [Oceanispirochaeta sp. M2]NPD70986.1 mechanosensitive ion channel [Oceanispirochaeta sp. M1]RDG33819.1 mechanosensitive ion channel protein MscS [Oceanispirochaeta sp. M1]